MPSVLFVCTANQFRSPLAAARFRLLLQRAGLDPGWTVESAGTWATEGAPILPEIRQTLESNGVNPDTHRPRMVTAGLIERFDLVVVMARGQKEALSIEFPESRNRVVLLSEMAQGVEYDIPDPVTDPRLDYEQAAHDLSELVEYAFEEIYRRAQGSSRRHEP